MMGTTKSSETPTMAEYLRSQRTSTEAEVREAAEMHDLDDVPAAARWSAVSH